MSETSLTKSVDDAALTDESNRTDDTHKDESTTKEGDEKEDTDDGSENVAEITSEDHAMLTPLIHRLPLHIVRHIYTFVFVQLYNCLTTITFV